MVSPYSSKVFGIGLNKTGTTTLGQCYKALGLTGTSYSYELLRDISINQDFEKTIATVNQYDGFEDWPWPLIYKELDTHFPGSKFILTTRKDPNTWLKSLEKHSLRTPPFNHCRKFAYGYHYPQCHRQDYLDFYKKHNSEVREYFSGRPNDFIKLCWENGDGWEKLCNFLGKPTPDLPFPHANKSKNPKKMRILFNYILLHLRS